MRIKIETESGELDFELDFELDLELEETRIC